MKRGKKDKKNIQYKKAIDYLLSNLPMYQREGGMAFKPGLENSIKLLKVLNDPHKKFKAIHIAGTNGKGSVSHMLSSVLMKHGFKTGLYTSPHLFDFRERIRVNGKKIKKKFIIEFVKKIKPVCEEIKPSFFELTMTMSFAYFASKKVKYAVVETGMGGRLDSTNILLPILSVITNIAKEHTRYLGDTLAQIATEKAGIIKNEVPVVVGESHVETRPVFEQTAKEKNATLYFADQYFFVKFNKKHTNKNYYTVKKEGVNYITELITDLGGSYQVKNLTTLFTVMDVLNNNGIKLKKSKICKGLLQVKKDTGLLGRWDIMERKPMVILDTAHNANGLQELANQLDQTKYKKLFIVFGLVNDKDVEEIYEHLPKKAFYFFTKANMPRSMEINSLYRAAILHSLKGVTCANVKLAYKHAKEMAKKDDLVLITGSNVLVGEVLEKVYNFFK